MCSLACPSEACGYRLFAAIRWARSSTGYGGVFDVSFYFAFILVFCCLAYRLSVYLSSHALKMNGASVTWSID